MVDRYVGSLRVTITILQMINGSPGTRLSLSFAPQLSLGVTLGRGGGGWGRLHLLYALKRCLLHPWLSHKQALVESQLYLWPS